MYKGERENILREIKKEKKEFSEGRGRLEAATKKEDEAKKQSKNAQALYEACLAESGEARPELLQEVERLEREAKTQAATIRGLDKFINETKPAKIKELENKLHDLDVKEAQRLLIAIVPDLNRAARRFGELLREVDEIKFSALFCHDFFSYFEDQIPIVYSGGALSIPRFFIKKEFGGPGADDRRLWFWGANDVLCLKVLSGEIPPPNVTAEQVVPASKTLTEQIQETQAALFEAQGRLPGLIATRDAAATTFSAMPENEFSHNSPPYVADRQSKNDAEQFVNDCHAEILRLSNLLESLKNQEEEQEATK